MKIPPNNQWTSNSQSEIFGTLNTSFNLDLTSNKGSTRVSPRTVITTDDITNLGVAVGFVRFNADSSLGFFTVAGTRVFRSSSADPSAAFALGVSRSSHSSDTSDIIHFSAANKLVVTEDSNKIVYWNTSTWQDAGTVFDAQTPHMMCEYSQRLYVTDYYKKIRSFDTSFTEAKTGSYSYSLGAIDLDNVGLQIVDILSSSDGIWILTSTSKYGEQGQIIKWNGVKENDPTATYFLDSGGVMAGIIVNNVPYILSVEGELLVFNGGDFVRVDNGRLPINPNKYLKNTFSSKNDRWIHPNGITVTDEGKINILINNEYEDGTIEERLPSGIWEFDLKNTDLGWYHIASLSLYTNIVTDYGQNRVSRVGGLAYVKVPGSVGKYLIGAQLYSDASATKEVILTTNTSDNIQKYGYFVTSKILSTEISDMWQKICARFKKLTLLTDKIVLKYMVEDSSPIEATITWTSTNTFTTTTDVSGMTDYEVEVVQGKGSGKCSHVTGVSEAGGTYTVTVDETYDGVSGTAKARFQNWIKIGSYSLTSDRYRAFNINRADTQIKLKCCLQFTGKSELYDLLLTNKGHIKVD